MSIGLMTSILHDTARLTRTHTLKRKPEVKTLVAVLLPRNCIRLIHLLLFESHLVPLSLLLFVHSDQNLSLDDERNQRQSADSHQNRVTLLVVWPVVFAVYL